MVNELKTKTLRFTASPGCKSFAGYGYKFNDGQTQDVEFLVADKILKTFSAYFVEIENLPATKKMPAKKNKAIGKRKDK